MHFKSGGLYYMDRHGSRIDVDGAVELGDGLFLMRRSHTMSIRL